MSDSKSATPALVPYLAVEGAREAIDSYHDHLGAALAEEPIVMPDGRVGHSELRIGEAVLYLADAHPEIGVVAPTSGEATVSLMLEVTGRALRRVRRGDHTVSVSPGVAT